MDEVSFALEQARFLLTAAQFSDTREHADKAAALIAQTGYHRRDRELEELRKALAAATPQK